MRKRIRVAVLCAVTMILIVVYARGFSVREARPLAYRRERAVLRVWVTETFTGSLSCVARAAQRFERENPGVNVRIRRAQAEEYVQKDAVLPDVALYMPGVFSAPEELFVPLAPDTRVRAAFASAGKWQDQLYGLPVLAGAYGLMVNDGLFAGDFSLAGLTDAARPAQGKQGAVYALECPIDASLCFPAALLAQGGALLGGFPQGLMREAAPGTLSGEFLSLSREEAFTRFRKGKVAALLCTQREVRRMSALCETGSGFDFSVRTPAQAFCDQLLLCSVVSGGQEELSARFAASLLEEAYQRELAGYGFFTVLEGLNIYNENEMPRLYAMEQGLLSPTLICMNAYAGEKLALEGRAMQALENGGQDLMAVPFY